IDPPISSIPTEQVFQDSATATSGILGVYSLLTNTGTGMSIGSGRVSELGGLLSDELILFNQPTGNAFQSNNVLPDNATLYAFWRQGYNIIYQTNACIEGIENSQELKASVKSKLLAEAKFIRAFCYYYLVNYFENIPYVISTDWNKERSASQINKSVVFKNILDDLLYSYDNAEISYSFTKQERIRVTKWAAAALLARVYLSIGDSEKAIFYSTSVISNSSLFVLVSNPNDVFLKNNKESILQGSLNNIQSPFNATPEGYNFTVNRQGIPYVYLTDNLIKGMDTAIDLRYKAWVGTTVYLGNKYFYPLKYKVGKANFSATGSVTEYFVLLRLAEQHLLRAEAKWKSGDFQGAIVDINLIRNRAGLPLYSFLTADELLNEIIAQRRIEFFCEWGHRWLDLIRVGRAKDVLQPFKPLWKNHSVYMPIPVSELISDINLRQNAGY
ncbi:MAG: hypothetical protein DI539_22685, partial [Flavobacterium psychrophilum]